MVSRCSWSNVFKSFLDGNEKYYQKLKPNAMALGSAFQKVNFLRDLNADFHELNRTYFPNLDFKILMRIPRN